MQSLALLHLVDLFINKLKSGCQRRGSTEEVHTNIIDGLGGVMDKYNKHRFFTALVLEIRASLYSTPRTPFL